MSKAIGFEAALKLLREGHAMVHEAPLRTSINGLTIIHPGFHYLIPYCKKGEKQPNGDVFYTLKEKNE